MFLKLPANYSELSEQERKEWVAAAAETIRENLRDRKPQDPGEPEG
ncbi:MAG: hypothetical protein ABF384_17270 [Verrucomicrobiales bacterium]